MTDASASEHLDLDAASAAVDGGATPEQMVHLAGCADCGSHVDQLTAVARTVGQAVVPQPGAEAEAALAAALASVGAGLAASPTGAEEPGVTGSSLPVAGPAEAGLEAVSGLWPAAPVPESTESAQAAQAAESAASAESEPGTGSEAGDSDRAPGSDADGEVAGDGRVVPLAGRRLRQRRGLLIATAAAVVVAAIGVGSFALAHRGSNKPTALSQADQGARQRNGGAAPTTTAPPPGAAGALAPGAAGATTVPAGPPTIDAGDLGNQSDPASFAAVIRDVVDNKRPVPPAPKRDFQTTFRITICTFQNTPPGSPPQVLLVLATTVWKGTPAVVFAKQLTQTATPTRTVFVLALDTCATLLEEQF